MSGVWRKTGEAQNPSCLKSSVKFLKSVMIWSSVTRPVAIVDISTYRTIYGYERDHFWCRDILRLIIFL